MKYLLKLALITSIMSCGATGLLEPARAQSDSLPKLRIVQKLYRDYYTFGVAWSSNSSKLAAYSTWGNLVTVWSVGGTILREIRREGDHYVGKALAFTSGDAEIISRPASYKLTNAAASVFEIATGAIAREVPGPHPGDEGRHNWALGFAISPDRSLLAAAFDGGIYQPVVLYSTKDWSKVAEIASPRTTVADNAKVLAFSADGRFLAIGLPYDVLIYSIPERRITLTVKAFTREDDGCCISGVAFNPDASEVAVATSSFQGGDCAPGCRNTSVCCTRSTPKTPVKVLRVSDGTMVTSYPSSLWQVWDMAWSPDGRFIAFVTGNALHLWNPLQRQETDTLALYKGAVSLAFAPNGHYLAATNGSYITVFEITN